MRTEQPTGDMIELGEGVEISGARFHPDGSITPREGEKIYIGSIHESGVPEYYKQYHDDDAVEMLKEDYVNGEIDEKGLEESLDEVLSSVIECEKKS